MTQMNRQQAEDYLKRKGKIQGKKIYTKEEEKEIQKVMLEGKIYGDPAATIQF